MFFGLCVCMRLRFIVEKILQYSTLRVVKIDNFQYLKKKNLNTAINVGSQMMIYYKTNSDKKLFKWM